MGTGFLLSPLHVRDECRGTAFSRTRDVVAGLHSQLPGHMPVCGGNSMHPLLKLLPLPLCLVELLRGNGTLFGPPLRSRLILTTGPGFYCGLSHGTQPWATFMARFWFPGREAVITDGKILSVPAAAVTVSLASGGFAP